MITLIDADSIIYIVGWNFRERSPDEEGVIEDLGQALDGFVHGVLQVTQATEFAGYFSCPTADCFRTKIATYKPYKGTRPEKPEWIRTWEGPIKEWLMKYWGFVQATFVEADDCVAIMARLALMGGPEVCIASNDKDLKQVPCCHYSYKTRKVEEVSAERAHELFWLQMLTGDTSDNIAGVPGVGKVKAEKILLVHDPFEYPQVVMNEFIKHFGEEEGTRMFAETKNLVEMLYPLDWGKHDNFSLSIQPYDLEGVRDMLQNNPVYNQYNNSNNDYSFSDFL